MENNRLTAWQLIVKGICSAKIAESYTNSGKWGPWAIMGAKICHNFRSGNWLWGCNPSEPESLRPLGPRPSRNKALCSELGEKGVRGQMVAGEWVSDYSKRPARPSIPRLRLERVELSQTHSETKMELMRGNGKRWGPRRGQGHWEAEARTMKSFQMGVGRAVSASVVRRQHKMCQVNLNWAPLEKCPVLGLIVIYSKNETFSIFSFLFFFGAFAYGRTL